MAGKQVLIGRIEIINLVHWDISEIIYDNGIAFNLTEKGVIKNIKWNENKGIRMYEGGLSIFRKILMNKYKGYFVCFYYRYW